jgi:hypothetical protein
MVCRLIFFKYFGGHAVGRFEIEFILDCRPTLTIIQGWRELPVARPGVAISCHVTRLVIRVNILGYSPK